MQRKLAAVQERPDTGRLNEEINKRREDVAFLQQQLRTMEGRINELSHSVQGIVSYTNEVKRLAATMAQSCEASARGVEQEKKLREQAIVEEARIRGEAIQQLSANLHLSLQKATAALQAEFSLMMVDVREVKQAQSQLSSTGNSSLNGHLDVFKQAFQQGVEELKQRTGSYDAMFVQLNQDNASARLEASRTSQTLVSHSAAIEHIGKTLNAISEQVGGNASRIAQFIAAGEASPKKNIEIDGSVASLNARIDGIKEKLEETQAAVESGVESSKVTFDIHRQVLASLSQKLDALKDMPPEIGKEISRWSDSTLGDADLSPKGSIGISPSQMSLLSTKQMATQHASAEPPEQLDTAKVFKTSAEPAEQLDTARFFKTSAEPPEQVDAAKVFKTSSSSPRTVATGSFSSRTSRVNLIPPPSPPALSRPFDDEENARQKYLRLVPVQHRKTMIEHEKTQPWLEKSWAERLKLAEKLLPTFV